MRKTKEIFILIIAVLILLLVNSISAIEIFESCKDKFKTTEEVTVRSNVDRFCVNKEEGAEVEVYIVEDKDSSPLNILMKSKINNTQFSCKKIWDSPKVGDYDVFIDCNENEEYDSNEPFDSFEVIAVEGDGKARRGEKDIRDHSWFFDREEPNLINEMLQLSLLAENENIVLETLTIRAIGSGNDTEIEKLEIYLDENNNGKVDEDELLIGDSQPAFLEDNGVTTLNLDYVLVEGIEEKFLIVYTMKEDTPEGEFSLVVDSIVGIGENSEKEITFSGLPLTSGTKSVLPEKTCLGSLTFELEPNPVVKNSLVTARISGLSGCENKTIVLRLNPCGSSLKEEIAHCIFNEKSGGCNISFLSSSNKTYHACIDKNNDGDMIDFGEYDFKDLVVVIPEKIEENETEINETETNVTEFKEEKEDSKITASVTDIEKNFFETGGFFLLLEVTLLLILFVLVMILFKMRDGQEKED